jgi:hypothetical protein
MVKLPNRKIISVLKRIIVISMTGTNWDVCLMEMEISEEFLEGVRLEMLAAAYGSKWTFPLSLSKPCKLHSTPFRPPASSTSFQINIYLS